MIKPTSFSGGHLGASCRELEERIGVLFHAVDGPQQAFFELGKGPAAPFRVVYTAWAYGYGADRPAEELEQALCERMFEELARLTADDPDRRSVLFWRRRPYLTVGVSATGLLRVAVRMRFAVPDLDLTRAKHFKMEGEPIREEPLLCRTV